MINKNIRILLLLTTLLSIFFLMFLINIKSKVIKSYAINENIIVSVISSKENYILNLNTLTWKKFDWNYISDIVYYDIKDEKIYNKNSEYYFTNDWLFLNNWNKIYSFTSVLSNSKLWTWDWKYLISNEWYNAKMFWILFWKRTTTRVITLIEPIKWKSIQLNIKDENGKFLKIDKILWTFE